MEKSQKNSNSKKITELHRKEALHRQGNASKLRGV
jgi:hypothetical protein